MKMKILPVAFVTLLVISSGACAMSLSDVWGLLGNFITPAPDIISAGASPIKVYPGQELEIIVAFRDSAGIESAYVTFPFEGGQDIIEMSLHSGNEMTGIYRAAWKVHDTAPKKYSSTVSITNRAGISATRQVSWEDPTVSHSLYTIYPGISQDALDTGYAFWSDSSSPGSYGLGAFALGSSGTVNAIYAESLSSSGYPMYLGEGDLKIEGNLVVDGTINPSCIIQTHTGSPVRRCGDSGVAPNLLVSGGCWVYGTGAHLDSDQPGSATDQWQCARDGGTGTEVTNICC